MQTAITRTSGHYLLEKPPDQTSTFKNPNWRVQPFLMLMEFIFPIIWMLGVNFSIDEMTMHLKVRHADKKRMTYKEKCDISQTYDIFQKGYT